MTTLTIPKEMMRRNDNLVIIPKEDYERFLRLERLDKKTKGPTELAIEEGLRDLRAGRITPPFSSIKEFKLFLKKR